MKKKKRLQCYVRPYRLRWGLSQAELAFIIGTGRNYISYLETEKRRPKLSDAFALQVIFGVELTELFPTLFAETEDGVLARAYDLYERLQGQHSEKTRIKLDFLEEIFESAKRKTNSNKKS